jgi:hypothetical protein
MPKDKEATRRNSVTRRRGVPLSVRLAPDNHDWVIAGAGASGQSITDEVNRVFALARAIESDALMSPQQRHIARQLSSRYIFDEERFGGVSGVVYALRSLEDPKTLATPDDAEMAARRKVVVKAAMRLWPERDADREDEFFAWLKNEIEVVDELRRARKKHEPEQ